MTVCYWNKSGSFECEKSYENSPAGVVLAYIEMYDCLVGHGYCLLEVNNRATMITSLEQIAPLANSKPDYKWTHK